MRHEMKDKPDAFKALMANAKFDLGRSDLPHQSLGRALTPEEEALADGLMQVYAEGASGPAAIAAGLAKRGVVSPQSGKADWTAESVARELAALNADLDRAYAENGSGGGHGGDTGGTST